MHEWAQFIGIMVALSFFMFLLRGCFLVAGEALQEQQLKRRVEAKVLEVQTRKMLAKAQQKIDKAQQQIDKRAAANRTDPGKGDKKSSKKTN